MNIETIIRCVGEEVSLERRDERLFVSLPFSYPARLTLSVREEGDELVFSDGGAVLRALGDRVGDLAPYREKLREILAEREFLRLSGGQIFEWSGGFTDRDFLHVSFFDFLRVLTVISHLDAVPMTERQMDEEVRRGEHA